MKNLFLKLYSLWIVLLGMICFASCNDDEQDGESQNLPSLPSLGITEPVTAIDYGRGVSTFDYADGRLVGGNDYGVQGGVDFIISYSPLSIKGYYEEVESDYSYVYELIYSNIRTNSMGCITSVDITYRETESDGIRTYIAQDIDRLTAQYNEGGYLTRMDIQTSSEEDGALLYRSSAIFTQEWSDGNLARQHWYSEEYEGDSNVLLGTPIDRWITYYYADDAPKNNGIYLDNMIYDSDLVTYAGFWGKTTQRIPTSSESLYNNNPQSTITYSVDLDDKGRIVALSINGVENMRYGYVDCPLTKVSTQKSKAVKGRLADRLRRRILHR